MSQFFKKQFEMMDQERFAEVSGDRNPMHLDPLAARRTQMGALVVHGMHTVLLCLDAFTQDKNDLPAFSGISVNFLKPVYVGDEVYFSVQRLEPLRLAAEVKGVKVITLDLLSGPANGDQGSVGEAEPLKREPRERDFSDLEKAAGKKERMALSGAVVKLFPHAARWFGAQRVAALAAVSAIVGMECPGLHSIFIGLTLNCANNGPSQEIEFSVLSTDDRFRRVKLAVSGGGWEGTLDAAVRTAPIHQPGLKMIASQIKPGIFSGQRVLIVGGSRGIGEYTAKVIATGGGQVALTYATGKTEAEALAEEIKAFGASVDFLPYDVRLPAAPQLEKLKFLPTHVYYFATGRIFGHHSVEFDEKVYEQFRQFYVSGFRELCAALAEKSGKFSIFYPSSVAVDKTPKGMEEYAKAKAEGERFCSEMKGQWPDIRVIVHRLPRLLTDQTATLIPAGEAPIDSFLPIILETQGVR